jgi:aromatic ring hydroxylase
MRTGAEYRDSLRDGRRVWLMGGGWIDDVTTHPATRPMVDEYVAWYDRHFDPERQNFRDYNELANGVLRAIDMPMPEIDMGAIPKAPISRRRFVAAATDAKPGS